MLKNKPQARRNLLKTIATGGSVIAAGQYLPEAWVKPAVNAVLLPAHAETSQQLTYSCSITGVNMFDVTIQFPIQGPVDYTITNTGTGPLTAGVAMVSSVPGNTGGIDFTPAIEAIPDPMLPGTSVIVSLTDISAPQCGLGGAGTLEIEFSSNETTCQLVINVTCSGIG